MITPSAIDLAEYKVLIDQAPIGIYTITPDGIIDTFNKKMVEMNGTETADAVIGLNIREIPTYESSGLSVYLQKGLKGESFETELLYTSFVGEKTTYRHYRGVPIFAEDGKTIRKLLLMVEDITEKKNSQETLNLLKTAVMAAVDGVVITDKTGTIVWVNPAFTHLTGYEEADAIGNNPRVLKSGKQNDQYYKRLWETISSGKIWTGEIINKRKDGTFYIEEMSITPVKTDDNITHYIAIKHDITDKKMAADKLAENEQKYRSIFESSPEVIMLLDRNGTVIDINGRVYDWIGYTQEEIRGKSLIEFPFLTSQSKIKATAIFAKRMLGMHIEPYELDIIHKSTEKRIALITGTTLKDLQGQPIGDIVLASDITDRKQAEKKLLERTEELERLNTLMVGRELKMISLKEQIQQLENKIQQIEHK